MHHQQGSGSDDAVLPLNKLAEIWQQFPQGEHEVNTQPQPAIYNNTKQRVVLQPASEAVALRQSAHFVAEQYQHTAHDSMQTSTKKEADQELPGARSHCRQGLRAVPYI